MNKLYLYTMINNLKDVIKKFNSESDCRAFLVQQRWNGSPICPHCGCDKWYSIEDGKRFKCASNTCYKKYSVTVGTIFESSKIPLSTWFMAVYLLSGHKKGISSIQLAKDLNVTQKTAWFMTHRLRESLRDDTTDKLTGTVEVDETYMGRKYRSDFKGLTEEQITVQMQKSLKNKGAVLGMAQRSGKVVIKAFDEINAAIAKEAIKEKVEEGASLYTDQSSLYRSGLEEYGRAAVRHTNPNPEWVRGDVHTNTIENFWSVMKRGLYGIYHQVSFKHLQRYCDEFAYRYNSRSMKDGERFIFALANLTGRLKYKTLVHGKSN